MQFLRVVNRLLATDRLASANSGNSFHSFVSFVSFILIYLRSLGPSANVTVKTQKKQSFCYSINPINRWKLVASKSVQCRAAWLACRSDSMDRWTRNHDNQRTIYFV